MLVALCLGDGGAKAKPGIEAGVLEAVARGDRDAMRACVEQYAPLVWAIASRFIRDRADAEDAAQEAFIALWKAASRFDPTRSSERTFIAMIARRRVIDRLRAKGRRPEEGASEQLLEDLASSAHLELDRRADAARAISALGALPGDRKQVIALSVFDGLTQDEIATTTGLPLGTVKSHVRRGLEALRSAFLEKSGAKGGPL
ncbi:MAG: sigma-70 family RNA polymerase sigma factor [Myxococcota bacterium]